MIQVTAGACRGSTARSEEQFHTLSFTPTPLQYGPQHAHFADNAQRLRKRGPAEVALNGEQPRAKSACYKAHTLYSLCPNT